ncbi:MAG: hypothetical protein MUE43_11985 [Serpentinimonas sp.]|jgi:hypothetical protein|nr:hypothetical protein [Serpentinimonas sp.]
MFRSIQHFLPALPLGHAAPFLPWLQEAGGSQAPEAEASCPAPDWAAPSYLRRQRSGDSVFHARLHGRVQAARGGSE